MNSYYDLEIAVLSCLVQKPELMKKIQVTDKHFIKHQRLWKFMKSFYNKFETFDIILMYQICKDKFQIIKYIEWLAESNAFTCLFDKYQDQLIKLYHQKKKDKWIIDKVFDLTNELYVGNIGIGQFEEKFNQIRKEAKILFKESEN